MLIVVVLAACYGQIARRIEMGKFVKSSAVVTSSARVRSTLECATSCSRHPGCWLFNHNTEDLRCHLLQASWRDHAVFNHKLWRHGRIKGEQKNTSLLRRNKITSSQDRSYFYHCICWNKSPFFPPHFASVTGSIVISFPFLHSFIAIFIFTDFLICIFALNLFLKFISFFFSPSASPCASLVFICVLLFLLHWFTFSSFKC